jgi:transcriptional regulator GlxA family with amidase domain
MPSSVGFLLLPGFSLLSLGAASSVLSAANEVADEPLYRVSNLSLHGGPVTAQCGAIVLTDRIVLETGDYQALFILGDSQLPEEMFEQLREVLIRFTQLSDASSALGALGALGNGTLLLAEAGLLDGYRAAIDWQQVAQAVDRHPNVIFSTNVFEIDRDKLTCGNGITAMDLLLNWLASLHGRQFVADIGSRLGIERIRASEERQPMPSEAQPGMSSARLKEALELMEANLGEPLQTEDIARLVGISRRQLERLFRQHLDSLPARHYLEMRLKHAQRQIRHTSQSILQISLICGFSSAAHFSTAYRSFFGRTPREERSRLTMPKSTAPVVAKD